MAKYVFVTGGVTSSLGKGITAASVGRLLKARGLALELSAGVADGGYERSSAGWLFDCMDARIFTLAREPALRELLGAGATDAQVKDFSGWSVAMMMIGWASGGIVFGPTQVTQMSAFASGGAIVNFGIIPVTAADKDVAQKSEVIFGNALGDGYCYTVQINTHNYSATVGVDGVTKVWSSMLG